MNCIFITGIIIPLVSAVIGGGLTLLGVWFTIRNQSKKEEIARKAAARPWIFSCETCSPQNKKKYFMVPDSDYSQDMFIAGTIKNTDNGILILDHLKSKKVQYFSSGDKVVDKNTVIELVVLVKNRIETLEELYLYINDVYGNQYRYELLLAGNRFTLGESEEAQPCPTSIQEKSASSRTSKHPS